MSKPHATALAAMSLSFFVIQVWRTATGAGASGGLTPMFLPRDTHQMAGRHLARPFACLARGFLRSLVGSPTLSADDLVFFYSRVFEIQESHRAAQAAWDLGADVVLTYSFAPDERPRVSSLSPDLLTLFFWDDIRQVGGGAWRTYATDIFSKAVSFGPYADIQPISRCSTELFAWTASDGDVYLTQLDSEYNP
jgi:hypothetical protein